MSVKMDGEVYSCPVEIIWTPAELQNETKRKCEECGKICNEIFLRVFGMNSIQNYCSQECYESA